MRKWNTRLTCASLATALALTATVRGDDAKALPYSVKTTWQIGGEGGWDYALVDGAAKRLYVTRGNHLQVIDTDAGKLVADIPKCAGHGVAVADDINRGFTSDGRQNTVTIFDLKTNTAIGTIQTGQNPDCIIYDPASKRVFAFNGRSNDATVIDAGAAPGSEPAATIPLEGKPEFAATDNAGHVYVNLENKNAIVVIDSKTLKVTDTWKLDGAESPSGLAIDIEHHHLFAGCDGKVAVVDTTTGKTIATPAIGDGVDACGFDPGTGEAFASCGDGTLAVIKETSPGKFETIANIPTKKGSRTMALDSSTHTIYLATAEMQPPAAGERRSRPKPGSFGILVVTKQ